jgi:hypothetical protein
MTWKPLHLIAVALAGWMNRQQQEAIEYLRTENRILREKLGHKRLIPNESQKRRLAEAAGKLGSDVTVASTRLDKWNAHRRPPA